MQYVLIEREHDLDDEPYQVFSEQIGRAHV